MSYGILRLKLTASGRVHLITHSQDLENYFPKMNFGGTKNGSFVCLPCLFSLEYMVFYCVCFIVPVFLSSYLLHFGSHFAFLLFTDGELYNDLSLFLHFCLHKNKTYDNLWNFCVTIIFFFFKFAHKVSNNNAGMLFYYWHLGIVAVDLE